MRIRWRMSSDTAARSYALWDRVILGIIFVFITAPVAGHLVCRAAYRSRVPLAEGSGDDALNPVLFGEDLAENESSEQLVNLDLKIVDDESQGK